jgi:hypothetical protein
LAFRAGEAAASGYETARRYLIRRDFSSVDRQAAELVLQNTIDRFGPVVEGYPTWHPLVCNHDRTDPETFPSEQTQYQGLDHTILFAHAFITCPYGNARQVIDAVENLPSHPCASIVAEQLAAPLYNSGTTPVLVYCDWSRPLETGKTIPKSLAVPLMLEMELPCWRWSSRAESWETMRPYLLGIPHGSRSSLFVSQDTALAMKDIYMSMVLSGMFGPPKLR